MNQYGCKLVLISMVLVGCVACEDGQSISSASAQQHNTATKQVNPAAVGKTATIKETQANQQAYFAIAKLLRNHGNAIAVVKIATFPDDISTVRAMGYDDLQGWDKSEPVIDKVIKDPVKIKQLQDALINLEKYPIKSIETDYPIGDILLTLEMVNGKQIHYLFSSRALASVQVFMTSATDKPNKLGTHREYLEMRLNHSEQDFLVLKNIILE